MHSQTKEALNTATEFLKDSVATAHMILKRELEIARKGETMDLQLAMQAMKEGRAAAKQITQNASLELRDRKLKLQEEKANAEKEEAVELDKPPTPEARKKFFELSTEWMGKVAEGARDPEGPRVAQYPDELKGLLQEYGLDPDKHGSLDRLGTWLFPEQAAVA